MFQASQEDPLAGGTYLDPETNLHILDAFELPLWNWSVEKNGFEKSALSSSKYLLSSFGQRSTRKLSLVADAESRVLSLRNRLFIIRQIILRNEHFTASALPSRDRDILLEVKLPNCLRVQQQNLLAVKKHKRYTRSGRVRLSSFWNAFSFERRLYYTRRS